MGLDIFVTSLHRAMGKTVSFSTLVALALVLCLLFVGGAALAQQAGPDCRPPADMTEHLRAHYGESPMATGHSVRGYYLVLYVNGETLTWTIALVTSEQACIVEAGKDWQMIPELGSPV